MKYLLLPFVFAYIFIMEFCIGKDIEKVFVESDDYIA